jgi:hypothetical protein
MSNALYKYQLRGEAQIESSVKTRVWNMSFELNMLNYLNSDEHQLLKCCGAALMTTN